MKLKKSTDSSSRREKKSSKSQSSSILLQSSVDEDARGLLSKENPADNVVKPTHSTAKRDKKNWSARLGFGRSSNNGTHKTTDVPSTSTKKSKREKKPSGYTQSLKTPKGMKDRGETPTNRSTSSSASPMKQPQSDSSRTRPRDSSKSLTSSSTKNQSKSSVLRKLAPPKSDTERFMTNPGFYETPQVTQSSKFSPEPQGDDHDFFATAPREQLLFSDPAITMEEGSDVAGGFEITFEKEADSSRLTATTVSSVPTAATAAETVSTKSSSSSSPLSDVLSHHTAARSPMSVKSLASRAASDAHSHFSITSLTSKPNSPSSKQQQQEATHQKSPVTVKSLLTGSNKSSSTRHHVHSPVAHAAAQALVALSGEDKDTEEESDFGENDFDPNDDDDDESEMTGPSAFQFNLAASNLESATAKKAPITSPGSDGGFSIRKTKSSVSMGTPKPVTQPTVSSTTSNLSKDKQQRSISASGSVVSQQTSTSSSLFPSSCGSSTGPTSVHSSSEQQQQQSSTAKGTTSNKGPISPAAVKRQQSKALLARPFGRQTLSEEALQWNVEVSPAEWDNPERKWKYRIQVAKPPSPTKAPSAPSAVTWRSMENFVWLEQALTAEFQGGLVLPLLSIAVGMTDLDQVNHEVDANLLKDWLSDVLNGIRGQGELVLQHKKAVELLRSEALEAFLYRNTAPLQKPGNLITSLMGESFVMKQEHFKEQQQQIRQQVTDYDDEEEEERNCNQAMCKPSISRLPHSPSNGTIHSRDGRRRRRKSKETFVSSFWSQGPLALITDELCNGMGCQAVEISPSSTRSSMSSPDRFTCSSRALGTADTLDVQDSFLDSTIASMRSSEAGEVLRRQTPKQKSPANADTPPSSWKLAQSTSLIEAERDLALSYRKTALSTMEKVQVLVEVEENVGLAWKRFGIAISNLFTYEKEVENARLGEKKIHRDAMPYRKVKKATVDSCLKALTQQKIDRSVPALKILRSMLTAYVADLSAVSPAVEAYLDGMAQVAAFDDYFAHQKKERKTQGKASKDGSSTTDSTSSQTSSDEDDKGKTLFGSWSQQLRSFTSRDEDRKPDQDIVQTSSSSSDGNTADASELPAPATEMHKKRLVEDRVMSNERLLRESLTALCKSATLRSARMAYAYFKSEASQCGLLRSAAISLRSKIDLANKEALAEMISRHQAENKEDVKTELALAQRIVNLGNTKKFADEPGANTGKEQERAMSALRDNALQVARERVGRWNSELAMSMMKAVGVNDPNVRVEETTRELRLVRKYAIGLREMLNKCIYAVDQLRQAVLKGGRKDVKGVDHKKKMGKHIGETRQEYFAEAAKLFSGVAVELDFVSPKNSLPSPTSLTRAGIKLNDPFGWSTPFVELTKAVQGGNPEADVGSDAQKYIEGRDSQTEWMLSSISGLLNEYTQRVEVVESFVYMECVGVQLEKHFNKRRTGALSAFEKKTDVTTAINIATRKRIPKLVEELKAKLDRFGPDVTHTAVKETKEAHLESKAIKQELHELALRRLLRARETSTERVIDLLKLWTKEEESACVSELNTIRAIMQSLETGFLRALG